MDLFLLDFKNGKGGLSGLYTLLSFTREKMQRDRRDRNAFIRSRQEKAPKVPKGHLGLYSVPRLGNDCLATLSFDFAMAINR